MFIVNKCLDSSTCVSSFAILIWNSLLLLWVEYRQRVITCTFEYIFSPPIMVFGNSFSIIVHTFIRLIHFVIIIKITLFLASDIVVLQFAKHKAATDPPHKMFNCYQFSRTIRLLPDLVSCVTPILYSCQILHAFCFTLSYSIFIFFLLNSYQSLVFDGIGFISQFCQQFKAKIFLIT